MRHLKLFVLLALLAAACMLYAQRNSSAASQPQQGSGNNATNGTYWTCPMWGWVSGPRNQADRPANGHGPMGPGMMYGQYGSGHYGPMGPGMMYSGPANSGRPQSGDRAPGSGGQQPAEPAK